MTTNKRYQFLLRLGKLSGCHQMPERSFTVRGAPFPVCARCCGVLLGYLTAAALFFVWRFSPSVLFFGCFIMFFDWYLQHTELLSSTNARRFITGVIGGYSFLSLEWTAIKFVFSLFVV